MITITDKIRSLMFRETDTSFIFKKIEHGYKGGDEPFAFSIKFFNRGVTLEISGANFSVARDRKRFIDSLEKRNLDKINFNLITYFSDFFVYESKTNKKIGSLSFRHRGEEDYWLCAENKLKKNKFHCETGPARLVYDRDGNKIQEVFCIEGEDLTAKYNINNVTDLQNHLILK